MTDVVTLVASMPMHRGTRVGNPKKLTGPTYFINMEVYAQTYGTTAPFRVKLTNPLVVDQQEWYEYTTSDVMRVGPDDVAAKVRSMGYDSVVNVRDTPGGQLITVFLVNPKQATLLRRRK